jgi:hypothetical protein
MPRGFGGGGFRGGGFRGGYGMRRGGMPLLGMGMGMGSPLLSGLMTGGIGYLLGRSSNQPVDQQVQQVGPTIPRATGEACVRKELRQRETCPAQAARRVT